MEQTRAYSGRTTEALQLLASRIRLARQKRQMTTTELAERVGVSRITIRKIEQGSPGVRIGLVFEAASILGVALFDEDPGRLALEKRQVASELALLPLSVRKPAPDDDF